MSGRSKAFDKKINQKVIETDNRYEKFKEILNIILKMYQIGKIRIVAIISKYFRVRGDFPFLITLNTY